MSSTYTATGLVPSTTYNVSVRADGGVANGGVYSSTFSAPANATTSPDGLSGTRISPLFFGQNAWLPLKIGIVTKGGDLEELLCGASYASDGICVTDPPAEVQASGVKLMRYGGSGVDNDYDTALSSLSPAQYLTMVDNMRANGIEPLLEVPYSDGAYGNLDESAAQAAALVHYINITHDRCVRYWTIANEPDHYVSNDRDLDPTLDSTDIAANIATYFKAYVTAMRNVDPTIVIVGPDLSFYDDGIMSELLAPGGPNEICSSYLDATGTHYYLDVVDFHNYPFSGLDPGTPGDPLDPPAEDPDQTRPNIIAYPQGGFQDKVTALAGLVKQCNDNSISPITGIISPRTGTEMLKMAVTEINIEYRNPADKTLSGVSAQSFLAGQYWADVMNVGMQNGLEFMAFWSVKEGDPLCELGYIRNNDNAKLPTYYHYQMLAQNFRGVYAAATLNGSTTNVKAFGAKDLDQIVVMLLNQNRGTAALTYTVRLNGGPINNNKALKVNINAGVAKQYNNPAGEKLAPDSTVMLVFDQNGDLLRRHVYDLNNAATGPTPPLP